MRKKELIAFLESIPGNPQVALWNGYVDDYMILNEATTIEIVKESRESVQLCLTNQATLDNTPAPTKEDIDHAMTFRHWGLPNQFVKQADYPLWYGKNRRTLILLDSKPRGKKSWDRLGTMEY